MKTEEILTVAQADARLDEIERHRAQISLAMAACGSELDQAESGLGEAILSGNETAVHDVAALRLRADGLTAAITALDRRRGVAVIDQKRATVAEIRTKAQVKRTELDRLEGNTRELLHKLSILEGVDFDASILLSQRVSGTWFTSMGGLNPAQSYHGPLEVFRDPSKLEMYCTPRSRKLRDEATALDLEASNIEAQLDNKPSPVTKSKSAWLSEVEEVQGPAAR